MREGLKPDRPVEVGIRPEDVRIFPGEATAFQAEVSFVEELGATQLFHGKVGNDEFVVQAPTGQIPADTRQLALAVDPSNVHLFDPGTGQRLGRG
jgi:sn-glycerol 3-phosphate transport system ATP-binding protein